MLCDSFVFLVMREVCEGEEVYAGGELFYIYKNSSEPSLPLFLLTWKWLKLVHGFDRCLTGEGVESRT